MTIKIQGVENMNKQQKLKYVLQLSKGQMETEEDPIALFSNISAIIKAVLPDLNWAGFYFVKGEELVLGPFQGLPACTRLQRDKGVCAKAWREKKPVRVDDVDSFPGHVACDSASKSELVLPLIKDGEVIGVLDLDSPILNRFSQEDEEQLLKLVDMIVNSI